MKITLPNGIVVDNITPEELPSLTLLIQTSQTEEEPHPVPLHTPPPVTIRQNGDPTRNHAGDLIIPRGLSDKLREVFSVIVEFGPIHIGEIAELLDIPKDKVSSRLHLLHNRHGVIERVRAGVYQAKR